MFSSLLLAVLTLIFLALLLFRRYQAPSPPDQSKPQPSYPQQQPRQARGPNNAVNEGDANNNLSTVHLSKHLFSFINVNMFHSLIFRFIRSRTGT